MRTIRVLPTNNDIKSEECVESEDDPENKNEVWSKHFDALSKNPALRELANHLEICH